MESFDCLIISLLDSQANIGLFKNELQRILDIPLVCIGDPVLENELVNGVVKQYLCVEIRDKISKENLEQLNFDYYHDGFIVFEIGDTVL